MHQTGVYLPIGGHIELGEGIEDAAKREVKEESGITIHELDMKGIVYIRNQNTGDYDVIMFVFTSTNFTGNPVDGREGKFQWVQKDKIGDLNLYEGDRIFLDLMLKNHFFVVDFLYDKFKLINHTILKSI